MCAQSREYMHYTKTEIFLTVAIGLIINFPLQFPRNLTYTLCWYQISIRELVDSRQGWHQHTHFSTNKYSYTAQNSQIWQLYMRVGTGGERGPVHVPPIF